MKSIQIATILLALLLPNVHAAPKGKKSRRTHSSAGQQTNASSRGTALTLKDGRSAMIQRERLMLQQSGGKYNPAPAGRYITREGKIVIVQNDAHIDMKNSFRLETTPQPEKKPAVGNGQRHQTGTNL